MKHTTVKPSNAESNQNNDNVRTYEPDSIHELLGFVKAAANSDSHEYTNLSFSYELERKGKK